MGKQERVNEFEGIAAQVVMDGEGGEREDGHKMMT